MLVVVALVFAGWARVGDFGTPADAKAMLEKAVAAVKKDKAKALELFTKGEGRFKDRDLYPCGGGADGKFTAQPKLLGQSLKQRKDKTSKAFGEEIHKVAQEGKISEVPCLWTRPNETIPVEKVAYVANVGDQACAVGYDK